MKTPIRACRTCGGRDRDPKTGRCRHCVRVQLKRRVYGLSAEDYQAMVRAHRGRCPICDKAFDSTKDTCVDHDHATGKVRGLLCSRCNKGLGFFGDSLTVLNRASQYLRRYHPRNQ